MPLPTQRMPKIPILLETEPEVGTHTGYLRQPECGVRRHAPLAVDHLVEAREGYPELERECRLRDPQRFQEFVEEHLTRVGRRPVGR